jgi:hypothetical protein
LAGGTPQRIVMEMMGHSNYSMTTRYQHVPDALSARSRRSRGRTLTARQWVEPSAAIGAAMARQNVSTPAPTAPGSLGVQHASLVLAGPAEYIHMPGRQGVGGSNPPCSTQN